MSVPKMGRNKQYNSDEIKKAGYAANGGVTMEINKFRGEYAFLSNFYKTPVEFGGLVYPCVENAFQAQKCPDGEEKIKYTQQNNPVRAKMMGKKEKLPTDWETRSVEVMEQLLRAKFRDPVLAEKLANTGDAVIVEGTDGMITNGEGVPATVASLKRAGI